VAYAFRFSWLPPLDRTEADVILAEIRARLTEFVDTEVKLVVERAATKDRVAHGGLFLITLNPESSCAPNPERRMVSVRAQTVN
jgi:hypothetical protein